MALAKTVAKTEAAARGRGAARPPAGLVHRPWARPSRLGAPAREPRYVTVKPVIPYPNRVTLRDASTIRSPLTRRACGVWACASSGHRGDISPSGDNRISTAFGVNVLYDYDLRCRRHDDGLGGAGQRGET